MLPAYKYDQGILSSRRFRNDRITSRLTVRLSHQEIKDSRFLQKNLTARRLSDTVKQAV